MHHQNGNRTQTFLIGCAQSIPRPGLIQGFQLRAIHRHAATDFNGAFMQQFRQAHIKIEQAGPRLIADTQQISKATIDQQQHTFTLAFQKRIGGDRGAHFHRLNQPGRNRRAGGKTQALANAGNGGVLVAFRVFRQQFQCGKPPGRIARDDIGKGAAAINPELPSRHEKPLSRRKLKPRGLKHYAV